MPYPRHWSAHRKKPGRHRHWGLRRRLTAAFAFVALAAVVLTTWLTLGAIFSLRDELFLSYTPNDLPTHSRDWNSPQAATAREAFRRVTRTAFFAAIVSFFLASGAAAAVTRLLTRPLLALQDGAQRLAAGERGIRLELPPSQDELRSLTESFNNLVTGLERQETFRRNMVADIAHDLRTPLAVLRSEIEAMQDGVVPQDAAALERLHLEVMLLSRLVDDLRILSLAESGGLSLKLENVRLEGLLQRVIDSFSTRAAELGSTMLIKDISSALSAELDVEQMLRVLGNLVENALRYASPGVVELGAARTEQGVSIWVRDRGPGLSKEVLEQMFERFYRGERSRTSRQDGSGLGLSIARAIVEAHGGELEAANHPQGGAIFSIRL